VAPRQVLRPYGIPLLLVRGLHPLAVFLFRLQSPEEAFQAYHVLLIGVKVYHNVVIDALRSFFYSSSTSSISSLSHKERIDSLWEVSQFRSYLPLYSFDLIHLKTVGLAFHPVSSPAELLLLIFTPFPLPCYLLLDQLNCMLIW
jgi:hypothetical protein